MSDTVVDASPDFQDYRAVETLYHAFFTGLILTTVSRRNHADAARLVFQIFRRQHLEKFLPGLGQAQDGSN